MESRAILSDEPDMEYLRQLVWRVRTRLPANLIQHFLSYKSARLNTVKDIEARRLEDLDKSRSIVFRYALPLTVIDVVAGSLASWLSQEIIALVPTVLFAILIFLLAMRIDSSKRRERFDIMNITNLELIEIREQEQYLSFSSGT